MTSLDRSRHLLLGKLRFSRGPLFLLPLALLPRSIFKMLQLLLPALHLRLTARSSVFAALERRLETGDLDAMFLAQLVYLGLRSARTSEETATGQKPI